MISKLKIWCFIVELKIERYGVNMNKRRLIRVIMCLLMVSIVFTACKKKKDDQVDSGIVSETPGVTQPVTPTVTPDVKKDNEPEVTPAPIEVTPEPVESISYEEAIRNIQAIIGERGYVIELLDDHLNVGESTYYVFQISDSSSVIEPNVIVDNKSGELMCYYSDGTTAPFAKFPLYTDSVTSKEEEDSREDSFTKEDALELLSKVDNDILGLPNKLIEYSVVFDDWTTNVQGTKGYIECYSINVYSETNGNRNYMGQFYVAVDGSVMYKYDSVSDEFVKIQE